MYVHISYIIYNMLYAYIYTYIYYIYIYIFLRFVPTMLLQVQGTVLVWGISASLLAVGVVEGGIPQHFGRREIPPLPPKLEIR